MQAHKTRNRIVRRRGLGSQNDPVGGSEDWEDWEAGEDSGMSRLLGGEFGQIHIGWGHVALGHVALGHIGLRHAALRHSPAIYSKPRAGAHRNPGQPGPPRAGLWPGRVRAW